MFPIAALPQCEFTVREARNRRAGLYQRCREATLDQAEPDGEIRVSFGQDHDQVKVIREHDRSSNREWVLPSRQLDRRAQGSDVVS
jgi:hypothetical protein